MGLTNSELFERLKFWYDGYTWNLKEFVHNPFSILNFFGSSEFKILPVTAKEAITQIKEKGYADPLDIKSPVKRPFSLSQ